MDNLDERRGFTGREWLLATGLIVLAAGLRWYRLAEWDMWTDEVQTLWMAMGGDFIEGPMYSTAPVNFWLTTLGIKLFGETALGIRVVPWLAGVATVAVFLWSASRWFGSRVAFLGATFLTLSMWHVGWSQTGRHFALQTLLVLLALHFFFVTWLGGRSWGIWASAAMLLGGIFTHSSTAFYLAAFLAFLGTGWLAAMAGEAERRPGVWLRAAIPYGVALALYLPIFFGIGRYLVANKTAWNPPWNIIGSLAFYLPPWILFTGLAGAFVLAARRQIHLAVLLVFLCLIPAVLVTVSSAITIASAAYCLASLPALAILIGVTGDWLLELSSGKLQRIAAVSLISGFFLAQGSELAHYYLVYNGLKARWEEVTDYVEQRRADGEEFFAAEGDVAQYYLGRGNARWLGEQAVRSLSTDGAWYAVYMNSGPFAATSSERYRALQGFGDLIHVFPLHYGAKDRSIAVFHVPKKLEGDGGY